MLFQDKSASTDGSEISQDALKKGIESGKFIAGRITFLCAMDVALERMMPMIANRMLPAISAVLAGVARESREPLDWALKHAVIYRRNVVGTHGTHGTTHADPVKA